MMLLSLPKETNYVYLVRDKQTGKAIELLFTEKLVRLEGDLDVIIQRSPFGFWKTKNENRQDEIVVHYKDKPFAYLHSVLDRDELKKIRDRLVDAWQVGLDRIQLYNPRIKHYRAFTFAENAKPDDAISFIIDQTTKSYLAPYDTWWLKEDE